MLFFYVFWTKKKGSFCENRVAKVIAREIKCEVEKVPRRGVGSSLLPHQRLTGEDRQWLDEISNETDKNAIDVKAKL